jgi:3-oxoacyl-(acyl-carrier-protein) synthase
MKVGIKEAVAICSLGNNQNTIIENIKREPTTTPISFQFGKETRTRNYKKILQNKIDNPEDFDNLLQDITGQLIKKAELNQEELDECALIIGSTSMNIPCSEEIYKQNGEKMLPFIGYGKVGETLAEKLKIGGEVTLFLTACTSSASAVLYAQRGIKNRRFKRAIVLGFEFYNLLTMSGFETLGLISEDTCKPFDKERKGIILGEGCAALLIEEIDDTNRFHLEVCGGDNTCDIASPTSHQVDGVLIAQTIENALQDASINKEDVTLIKAHATGSLNNDLAEGSGLKLVFEQTPAIVALKPYIGHTLGGCGAIELALLYFTLQEGFIPRTFGFDAKDEEIGIIPKQEEIKVNDGGICLINHFGFGGNGTVLVAKYGRF